MKAPQVRLAGAIAWRRVQGLWLSARQGRSPGWLIGLSEARARAPEMSRVFKITRNAQANKQTNRQEDTQTETETREQRPTETLPFPSHHLRHPPPPPLSSTSRSSPSLSFPAHHLRHPTTDALPSPLLPFPLPPLPAPLTAEQRPPMALWVDGSLGRGASAWQGARCSVCASRPLELQLRPTSVGNAFWSMSVVELAGRGLVCGGVGTRDRVGFGVR